MRDRLAHLILLDLASEKQRWLPLLLLEPPRPLFFSESTFYLENEPGPKTVRRAYADAMADGKAESENRDQAANEKQPRLIVGDGYFSVRVAMFSSGRFF
jgi:hypothetical protein